MTMPRFTAEASLGKRIESYVLPPKAPAETGRVLPQHIVHPHCGCYPLPGGGMICNCV
ncbi:MAG TPA: hypothetical protein VEN79_01615 [Terriglobia bacterium]|nr:hypothetical protein [Terriglobia bacterium]